MRHWGKVHGRETGDTKSLKEGELGASLIHTLEEPPNRGPDCTSSSSSTWSLFVLLLFTPPQVVVFLFHLSSPGSKPALQGIREQNLFKCTKVYFVFSNR